ncbi:MAG TPA: response regulator transcription factor [Candidatus Blautia pullistercoris]|uniref:Stage 0 sporulation protein A homolog n=1 Tax=Candidatus Blautia pullistercoris TaxID=2838499 RepID=A0A9D1VN70_9FIRM|nr:response regulator transcription factor [Candidatus Blautia pullistercoris]
MKLLIAEDEEDLNRIIAMKLRGEGYEVDCCFDGEEALEHLLYAEYDAAVLDIAMPVMDGLETVKRLRSQGKTTPVIFLTARDTVLDRIEGLDAGASDYVVKPFSFDELLARIRAVMRTARGSASEVYELDDLSLNTRSHIVARAGKQIDLTGKEYRLLEYLLINKNQILSRERILNHVWGYDFEGSGNVVDVYMNYVRKKIEADGQRKLIHTVRGIGYVMRVEENGEKI